MSEGLDLMAQALADRVDNVVLLEAVDSTHATALRLIQQMDHESLELGPTVLVADRQDKGMGRGGRSWISPGGGLYLSWLRSGINSDAVARLPMLAAAAAYRAISDLGIEEITLKWPNDLLVGAAKLAGILVHARHGELIWATVGIGVNVAAAPKIAAQPLRPATCLAELLPDRDNATLCAELAAAFVDRLLEAIEDPDPAITTWQDALIHRPGDILRVRLASGEELNGSFLGLSTEGFLRLEAGGQERVLTGGDILDNGESCKTTH